MHRTVADTYTEPFLLLQGVDYSQCQSAEDICEVSSKVITFIDLAGHQKYLRTTVFGLTAHCPEFVMLVVAGNTGIGKFPFKCIHLTFNVHVGDVAQW